MLQKPSPATPFLDQAVTGYFEVAVQGQWLSFGRPMSKAMDEASASFVNRCRKNVNSTA